MTKQDTHRTTKSLGGRMVQDAIFQDTINFIEAIGRGLDEKVKF